MNLKGAPIAVLDFETTGVDPTTCRPVSVAVVHIDALGESEPVLAFESLINPRMPIPAEATEIHGITDEMAGNAKPFGDVMTDLAPALDGRTLAAYNLSYDWQVLDSTMQRVFGRGAMPFRGICGYVMARAIDKYQKGKKLVDVAGRRGLTFAAHDAGADAMVTARLLPILLRELGRGKPGRYGLDGPWCTPRDMQSVDAFWAWTCRAGAAQEKDLAAYFARSGKTMDSMPWTELTKGEKT